MSRLKERKPTPYPGALRWLAGKRSWSYFFFDFCRLSFTGPHVASFTATRARRLMTVGIPFGGKASGWPIFQSVLTCLGLLVVLFTLVAIPPAWHN
jgi:hypothetical protein